MKLTTHQIDEALIARAQAGEVDAWEQLIAEFQGKLKAYIQSRCGHCLSALVTPEDIFQESMLQAWLDVKSLKQATPASFFAWLKAVADRRMSDAIKSERRLKRGGGMKRIEPIQSDDDRWHYLLNALPAQAKTASSILSRKEAAQALQASVRLLPDDQQRAIRLHFLEGMSLNETAETMHCTAAAVRGLLHRGKKRLANDLASASSWLGLRTNVTRLLSKIESGEGQAADELLPLVYDELRQLAAQRLRHEQPGQSLQATALVHEAFLRLVGTKPSQSWQSQGHFFAAAAEAMRRILIDRARKKKSQRRGGGWVRHSLDDADIAAPQPSVDLLALNEALQRLEESDDEKAQLVKLRYFAGLSIPQAAEVLGISPSTADRRWAFARAWLHSELNKGDDVSASEGL